MKRAITLGLLSLAVTALQVGAVQTVEAKSFQSILDSAVNAISGRNYNPYYGYGGYGYGNPYYGYNSYNTYGYNSYNPYYSNYGYNSYYPSYDYGYYPRRNSVGSILTDVLGGWY